MNEKALENILRIQRTHLLRRIREKMLLAPTTRYRRTVTDEIEQALLELERVHGATSALSSRVRARLLVPIRPPSPESTVEAIAAYVEGVAFGASQPELEDLAMSTHWPDVMRRVARYAPGPRRSELTAFARVVDVTTH